MALLSAVTTLTKVVHDHLITKFNGCFSGLTLLDVSGAHATTDCSCIPETLSLVFVIPYASGFLSHVCLFLSLQVPLSVLYFKHIGVPWVWS